QPGYAGPFLTERRDVIRDAIDSVGYKVELRRMAITFGPLWLAPPVALRPLRVAAGGPGRGGGLGGAVRPGGGGMLRGVDDVRAGLGAGDLLRRAGVLCRGRLRPQSPPGARDR